MDYQLLYKYFSGEASEAEVRLIFEWVELTPENKAEFIQLKKIWALTSSAGDNPEVVWKQSVEPKTSGKRRIIQWAPVLRYAAIVIIFFGLGIVFQNRLSHPKTTSQQLYASGIQVDVPLGQMSTVTLPDGTVIQLNSGTKIAYDAQFAEGKRLVQLEGEAYFDVAKDPEHPFIIQTKSLDFKVYGTSFNIQAYSNENEVNTTLVEGSLAVLSKAGTEYVRLVPGENANYNKETKSLKLNTVNTEMYTSWKQGFITFRNEPLQEIATKMERWYNVEIVINNPKLANELYFGTIMKNKPIDQILEVFKMTSSLNYRMIPRPGKPTLVYWE